MKKIASLTMMHLLSTFISTAFGTGSFNLGSDGSGKLVFNRETWKLILVAPVLTLATHSVWSG